MSSLAEIKTWLQQPSLKSKDAKGLSILFEGAQDSGALNAAEMLAKETGKPLHRIDLSTVVSKYIGETEKNIEVIFEKAKTAGAILFFDEADALFGKRTNVKDSHDRYANTAADFLLQQVSNHPGLVILATVQKAALDPALLKRFQTAVSFPVK